MQCNAKAPKNGYTCQAHVSVDFASPVENYRKRIADFEQAIKEKTAEKAPEGAIKELAKKVELAKKRLKELEAEEKLGDGVLCHLFYNPSKDVPFNEHYIRVPVREEGAE